MRILLVNKYHKLVGGADRYAFDLSRLLTESGHEVAFVAPDFPDNTPAEYPFFGVPQGLTNKTWEKASPLQKARAFADGLYNFAAERVMTQAIDSFHPDVVHCQNIYYQLSPSVIRAARKAGVPVVQTLHDAQPVCANTALFHHGRICEECRPRRFHRILANRCYNESLSASVLAFSAKALHAATGLHPGGVDRFITPSRFMKSKIESFGVRMAPIEQVNNFLRLETYDPNYEPGEYVLFFGQIIKVKGIVTLLNAMERLKGLIPLVIAGTGPLEETIRETIREKGIENVTMVGHKSGTALHELIRGARFVVVPSECYDNQPYAVLESFALGKPVIGSDIGGIPELLDESVGRLFTPGDAESLAVCIDAWAVKRDELAQMGRSARQRVAERHDPAAHMKCLEEIYDAVVSSSREKRRRKSGS